MAHNKKLMASTDIEKGQVVWAKLGGYPWWPGIVRLTQADEISDEGVGRDAVAGPYRITVKFIGENTQYFPLSAALPSTKVVDFEDYLLEHSRTKRKFLLRCIEYAKKFANGDLQITELVAVNQYLERRNREGKNSHSPERPQKVPKKVECKSESPVKRKECVCESAEHSRTEPQIAENKIKVDGYSRAVDSSVQRPATPLLTAMPMTWNPVCEPVPDSAKVPSASISTDVKQPDPANLIKPLSLPYLRHGPSVHTPEPAEIANALLPLIQAEVPQEMLPRLLRILRHFYTSLPDSQRPLIHTAQRLYFTLKQQEVTRALKGMINLEVADAPQTPEPQIEKPEVEPAQAEVALPLPIEVALIKDDVSTCSLELSVPDTKPDEDQPDSSFPSSSELIADKDKRRQVCTKVFRILSSNHFPEIEARDLALKMEQRLRQKDPSMGDKYIALYKKMAKEIRNLRPDVLSTGN